MHRPCSSLCQTLSLVFIHAHLPCLATQLDPWKTIRIPFQASTKLTVDRSTAKLNATKQLDAGHGRSCERQLTSGQAPHRGANTDHNLTRSSPSLLLKFARMIQMHGCRRDQGSDVPKVACGGTKTWRSAGPWDTLILMVGATSPSLLCTGIPPCRTSATPEEPPSVTAAGFLRPLCLPRPIVSVLSNERPNRRSDSRNG